MGINSVAILNVQGTGLISSVDMTARLFRVWSYCSIHSLLIYGYE